MLKCLSLRMMAVVTGGLGCSCDPVYDFSHPTPGDTKSAGGTGAVDTALALGAGQAHIPS